MIAKFKLHSVLGVAFAILWATWACSAAPAVEVSKDQENALLAAGAVSASLQPQSDQQRRLPKAWTDAWETVIKHCGDEEQLAKSPVHRAIKAHACLALNRNDESLGLFLSLENDADREAWQQWSSGFGRRVHEGANYINGQKALAKYLEGDAWARLRKWEDAARCYRQATTLNDQCPLAWNAQGVACVYQKKEPDLKTLADARQCFEKACNLLPTFADAHASLGTYYLMIEAADTAVDEFTKAISHSKGRHSLARIGRACALLGKSRNRKGLQAAADDFTMAVQCSWVRPLAEENVAKLEREGWKAGGDKESAGGPNDAGFNAKVEARRVFDTLRSTPTQDRPQALNQLKGTYSRSEWGAVQSQSGRNGKWSGAFANVFDRSSFTQQNRATGEIGAVAGAPGAAAYGKIGGERSSSMNLRPFGNSGADARLWGMIHGSERGASGAGGATTEGLALEEALGDIAAWPTKSTWFGVTPGVVVPAIKAF